MQHQSIRGIHGRLRGYGKLMSSCDFNWSNVCGRFEAAKLNPSTSAVGQGSVRPFPEALVIKIRNIGGRPAQIESIAWRRRPWGSLYALQTFDPENGYPGPPATIDAGNARTF